MVKLGISPWAGTSNGSAIVRMKSGGRPDGWTQPSSNTGNSTDNGVSPSGAPPSTQAAMVSICSCVRRRIIDERPEPRIRMPWRHLSLDDLVSDGPRPRPCVLVGGQYHRRNLVGPVTADAVVEQNCCDVLVERRCITGRFGRQADACGHRKGQDRSAYERWCAFHHRLPPPLATISLLNRRVYGGFSTSQTFPFHIASAA